MGADYMKKGKQMEEVWKVISCLTFTCRTYDTHIGTAGC